MNKKKFLKRVASITLSAGLILSSANFMYTPEASAKSFKAENVLESLTPQQREALNQLELTEKTGLQGFKNEELSSDKEIEVIVQFQSKPGKIAVLDAEVKGKKLSKKTADAQVAKEHEQFKKDLQTFLSGNNLKGRKANNQITASYNTVYNGVSMKLPANQVESLLKSEVVKAVFKNETFKVDPITIQNENGTNSSPGAAVESIPYLKVDKLHQEGLTGKGIKVGVIDTGIDYNHPDLKKVYKGGYDLVDMDNDPMETTYSDWQAAEFYPEVMNGSTYYTSHGTHVAGTIAGQASNSEISVKGVAPDVDLYAYRVLGAYGSGTTEAVIAGIEKAVEDDMDIINLSLGAEVNDPYYPTSTAVNYAVLSGVTAVVAAGNAGSGEYTVGSPGTAALALTVGANDVPMTVSTFKGSIGSENSIELISLARNYSDQLEDFNEQSYDVVDVGIGSSSDYSGKAVQGKIALIARGELTLADKVNTAKQNGAVAVLLYNNEDGQISANLGEATTFVPTFSLTKVAGAQVISQLQAGKTSFTFDDYGVSQTEGDRLADFSSRGPVRQTHGIKPEVTAPGVSVLSTVPSYMVNPADQVNYQFAYARYSGTSMATPFTAGVAALMLQANSKLKPEDIKTALMNTADQLNGDYSVYEVGAGRVNPYNAVHNGASFQIIDKMLIPGAEDLVEVKALTGVLSFNHELVDNNLQIKKTINVKNNEKTMKSFSVDIWEGKGSNSLKENGLKILLPNKINVKGNAETNLTAKLQVHKKAKQGYYSGYITLKNEKNSSEVYRIPYSFRLLEEGFNNINIANPAYSPGFLNDSSFDPFRNRYVFSTFNLSAPMEKMDVVLQDASSGNDLGLVGTVDLNGAVDNYDYGLILFNGTYNKFTGDEAQPISSEISYVQEGHYKIKFVGTGLSGKVITEIHDLWVYLKKPSFTSSLDGISPFLEYKPGQETYPLEIQITDPIVDEMNKHGVSVDQSSNYMVYYWGEWAFPSTPIHMDKDGNFVEEIAMDESLDALPFRMDGYNAAGNSILKQYYFVKEGTPVTYPTSETPSVKTGDTVKTQIVLDNLKDISKSEWTFSDYYGIKTLEIVDASLTDAFEGKAKVEVKGDVVTVEFNEPSGTLDHQGVVDVTFKVLDEEFFQTGNVNPTVVVTDANDQTINVLNAAYNFTIYPQFSRVQGYVGAEGFLVEDGGFLVRKDWSKVGGSVKFINSAGNEFEVDSIADNGQFTINKLPLSKDPYIVEMKVPGHFFTRSEESIGFVRDGVVYGKFQSIPMINLVAGDVNQDNVIDVLDAIAIQNAWNTNDRAADINFDETVNADDMAFVQKNYLKKNENVENAPEPKESHNGKTLETILAELGI